MNREEFRAAKFGYLNRDRERLEVVANRDRNFDVPCVITGTVPFIKKGTKIKVIGRCIETDKLFFFLPTIGWRKISYKDIAVEQLSFFNR